jgi:hypothetical protein
MMWIVLQIVMASLVITGIVLVFNAMPCVYPAKNTYETFDVNVSDAAIGQRLTAIRAVKDTLQTDLSSLEEQAAEACQVFRQVRDSYVANRAVPSSETEYLLPKYQQTTRANQRKAEALKMFQKEIAVFSALKNVAPVMECFANESTPDAALSFAVDDLQRFLDTAEYKTAQSHVRRLRSTLMFNAPYLQQAVDILTKSVPEGFKDVLPIPKLINESNQLGRRDLLRRADAVLQRANEFRAEVKDIRSVVADQVAVSKQVAGVQSRKSIIA